MVMTTHRSLYSDLPETVPRRDDFPEVVSEDAPQVVERSGEVAKYLVHTHIHSVESGSDDASGKEPPERRILGLRRNIFFILAIIGAVFVIGTVVGTAVGVTASQRNSPSPATIPLTTNDDTPPSPAPNNPNNASPPSAAIDFSPLPSNISPASALSSANFTDPKTNLVHLHVYSQTPPPSNSLLVSVWNSSARIWTTYSISALLPSTYDLLPSTTISAYAYTNPTFQAGVLVLTSDFVIHQFTTTDSSMKSGWKHGPVGQGDGILTVGRENRKFGMVRPQCGVGEDCRRFFPPAAVAYQDNGGVVWAFNVKDMRKMEVGKGRANTEVGLVSLVEPGNEKGFNVSDIYWRVAFVPEGERELRGWMSDKEMSAGWAKESATLGQMASEPAGHNMAAFSYDLVNQMIVTLEDGGGRLGVRTLNGVGNQWTLANSGDDDDPAGLGDQKGNVTFTAVAGNSEKRVFGMVNGNIHEWRFSSGRPREWEYVGRVSTSPVLTG